MSRSIRSLLVLVPLLLPIRGETQNTVVSGRVVSAATGLPISGASVHVVGATLATVVSDSGCFMLSVSRNGARESQVVMQAIRTGYEVERQNVTLRGDTQTVNFALRPSTSGTQGRAGGSTAVRSGCASTSRGAVVTEYAGRGVAGGTFNGAIGATAAAGGRGGGGGRGSSPTLVARSASGQVMDAGSGRGYNPCQISGGCPDWNTESYDRIVDNAFLSTSANPLSTFSIDVDRASYSNIRRFITMGQKPQKDAVRIEEMINYFSYDYQAPENGSEHPFHVTTEVSSAPWAPANRLVRIALQGRRIPTASLPPANLVFLIDVSGSMSPANRLPLVKTAMGLLLDNLREQDHVSIVTYAGSTAIVLEPTPASEKARIRAAIDRLGAAGGTAGGAGLRLAYNVARASYARGGNNRVIISTDGDFNLGISSDAEMERLVEEERQGGTFLTVLGFGMGNLKDSKLEKLADKGNGNYAYIDDIDEAKKVLVHEMGGTLFTIAKDVKLQVEFNPAKVQGYRLIGYENRMLKTEDFANDRKDAGDMGAGHSVTALYEVIPVGVKSAFPLRGADTMRYQTPGQPNAATATSELFFVKLRYKDPNSETSKLFSLPVGDRIMPQSTDFRFTSAVAAFGMLLRESEYKGTATVSDVLSWARSSLGRDTDGLRAEFVAMVQQYQKKQDGER